MLARKCDFCGGFYESYEGDGDNAEQANAIVFVDRDNKNKHWTREIYDLCPKCMERILTMMRKEK